MSQRTVADAVRPKPRGEQSWRSRTAVGRKEPPRVAQGPETAQSTNFNIVQVISPSVRSDTFLG